MSTVPSRLNPAPMLTDRLMKHEWQRLEKEEVAIVVEQSQITGKQINGLFYRNHGFRRVSGIAISFAQPDPRMYGRLDRYITDMQTLDRDRTQIKQGLTLLLDPCTTDCDIRDALPEFMVEYLDGSFAGLQRVRSEAWSIQDNPRALRQYLKIREKMEYYSATRLLY